MSDMILSILSNHKDNAGLAVKIHDIQHFTL